MEGSQGFFPIAERRALEVQFQQVQKLDCIGKLAGGMAHDFNNLLTAIIGHSDLLLMRISEGDAARATIETIETIRRAAGRAALLTAQILAFSRKQILLAKVLDLNQAVKETARMLHRLLGEDISLVMNLASELGHVKVDPGQIGQVILNLALNARDAMPQGGKLIIETSNVYLDDDYAPNHVSAQPGPHVMLVVSDTGCGMDATTQARLFEPFFTTKEPGKGTGLGLSTVYGIVKQSGGNIWVYSELGRGTTFKVYLPRVESPVEEMERSPDVVETVRGWETILVVEDNELVRRLVCQALRNDGYQIIEAPGSSEALLMCEQHQDPIHLILADVIMPHMNGPELAKRLTSTRPSTKVLYMSGHTDNMISHHGVLDSGVTFIQKPFTPRSLVQKVREVLGGWTRARSILIVDDDEQVREWLRGVLQKAGYAVFEAANGKQDIERMIQQEADLLIIDLDMPEQEGLETIRSLRKERTGLRIVAMSGAFEGDFLPVAKLFGADATLKKPFAVEEVLEVVRELLGENRTPS